MVIENKSVENKEKGHTDERVEKMADIKWAWTRCLYPLLFRTNRKHFFFDDVGVLYEIAVLALGDILSR